MNNHKVSIKNYSESVENFFYSDMNMSLHKIEVNFGSAFENLAI